MQFLKMWGLVLFLLIGVSGCGLFESSVEITLPSDMYEGADMDEVIAEAEEEGMEVVEQHEDGSVTYSIPASVHNEMMEEAREGLEEQIEETKNDFGSIEDVTFTNNFREFTFLVDQEAFEGSFDGFAAFGMGITGMLYQMLAGVDEEEMEVLVHLENVDTGEVFDTIVYPDDMEEGMEPGDDMDMDMDMDMLD